MMLTEMQTLVQFMQCSIQNYTHENIFLVNMDYSTYNVKKYTNGAWEWASGLNTDGSGKFGKHAQRHMVVEAMQGALTSNDGIRSEAVYFNLIASPGYPEMMDEMIALNKDKKEIAFVIGDTPTDLKSDSTSLKNWATNNMPAETYAGVYYHMVYLQTYQVMMLLFHHQLLLYVQSHSQTKYHSHGLHQQV